MSKLNCLTCGTYGLPSGCPDCGTDSSPSIDLNDVKNQDRFIKKCEYNLIPHDYIGKEWNKNVLLVEHEDRERDMNFNRFIDQCFKFHEIFKNGKLVNKSFYFYAPPRFGKDVLAFSCMQFAEKNGLTVAPFLDTVDVKRLLVLGAENPRYKILGRIDYDRYLTSDVLFVSVTKSSYVKEAYSTILELLSKRSRFGLPTYVLSEYSIEEMTKDLPDYSKNKFLEASINDNALKYPAVIGYGIVK